MLKLYSIKAPSRDSFHLVGCRKTVTEIADRVVDVNGQHWPSELQLVARSLPINIKIFYIGWGISNGTVHFTIVYGQNIVDGHLVQRNLHVAVNVSALEMWCVTVSD